ncbi:MAG: hypothetical protein ACE5FE_09690 [Acidiferrobacterales bacterium]
MSYRTMRKLMTKVCSPSVASPFSGTKVHCTFVFIRFTPSGPHLGQRDVQGWIRNAGEMNGFLKTDGQLLEHPLVVEEDAIKLSPEFAPKLNAATITRYSEATETFPS